MSKEVETKEVIAANSLHKVIFNSLDQMDKESRSSLTLKIMMAIKPFLKIEFQKFEVREAPPQSHKISLEH